MITKTFRRFSVYFRGGEAVTFVLAEGDVLHEGDAQYLSIIRPNEAIQIARASVMYTRCLTYTAEVKEAGDVPLPALTSYPGVTELI